MDKSNLQFNFRGCSSKTCTSFECRRTSTTLFSEKNAMHTLWRYRSPTSTSYISALGMNRSKIQTVSETRGFYCYEKWTFIKQPKKGHFSKILGGTPPLTQFVPSNFTHIITHRPSNFPWEVLAPHFLHCQTQVFRSFELQNTPPPHSLNLFTPTNPTGSKVPIQTFQERSRATAWEMSTNVQRTFAGDRERCAQTFRERSREELS